MATPVHRRLHPTEVRHFGTIRAPHDIPDLTAIQTRSYEDFLQYEVSASERKNQGIESVLQEIFPVESYDKTLRLEYVKYDINI